MLQNLYPLCRFALGGFDGNKMVPSIKELDPPGMMEKLIKEKLL